MKVLGNRIISYLVLVLTTGLLSSCKFGFMSLDDKAAPKVEALEFSTDPTLQPTRLIIRTTKSQLDFGLCEQVLIQVTSTPKPNGTSFEVPVQASATIFLTSTNVNLSTSGGDFYSDPACLSQNKITTTVISSGYSRSLVYFKPTNHTLTSDYLNTFNLSATNNRFTSDAATPKVKRVARTLEFFGYTSPFSFGSCNVIKIQGKDALGNSFNEASKSIALNQSPTVGSFYSDVACSTGITSTTLPGNGNNSFVTIYFKADQTNFGSSVSLTLTGASTGFTNFNASITVNRVATTLEFYGYTSPFSFGSCHAISIQGKDALGNPFNNTARTINLSQSPTVGNFYSNSGCSSGIASTTLPGNGNNSFVTIYFKADQTNFGSSVSLTLTGASNGFTNFNASITVNRVATTLEFYGYTSPFSFGSCHAISIQGKDALGNSFNEASKSIALNQSPTVGSFYSDIACSTGITSSMLPGNGNNSSVTVYFKLDQNAMPRASVNLTPSFTGLTSTTATISISHLALDTSFSTDGMAVLNTGEILSMVKVSSGYLIAGYQFTTTGGTTAERAYIALIDTNGNRASFFTDSSLGNSSRINSMIVEGSNIYFAGSVDFGGTQGKDWLYGKLILAGTALSSDSNFPIQTKDLGAQDDAVIGIESVDANQLVLVGDKFDVAIAQKSDGTLGTPVFASYSNNASAKCVRKDSLNQILVGGTASNQMALINFNPASISLPSSPTLLGIGSVNAITLDASGKILLAGSSGNVLGVRRLNTNLSIDTSFGISGLITYSGATEAKDVTVDSVGQILVSGTSSNQMLIVRYQSDGSFINSANNLKTISFTGNSVANRIIFDSTNLNIVLGGQAGSNQAMARLTP